MNSIDSMNNIKPRNRQQSGAQPGPEQFRRTQKRATSQDLQASLDQALSQADRKPQALITSQQQAAVEAATAPMSWALPARLTAKSS